MNRRPRPAEPPNPLGLLIVATAALIAVILTFGVFLPALGALTGGGADAPAATANVVTGLPSRISVCGRDWERGEATRALTAAEVFARDEREPIVVDTGLFAACPAEVEAADGPVLVVYVQAGPDAFVPYSLAEGS